MKPVSEFFRVLLTILVIFWAIRVLGIGLVTVAIVIAACVAARSRWQKPPY